MTEYSGINISDALESIRKRLLDLTKRNRLLNYRRNKSSIAIVDEVPDQVFDYLFNQNKEMIFDPLPEPNLLLFDELYSENKDSTKKSKFSKKQLREISSSQSGIDINEELTPDDSQSNERHFDKYLQTKLFMPELETRLRRMLSNAKSTIEETGYNQLYIAIGFLKWNERSDSEKFYEAPLILVPVELQRKSMETKTKSYKYAVSYTGEDIIYNLSLAEKLKHDFDCILPDFEINNGSNGGSEESDLIPSKYFDEVLTAVIEQKGWTINRKVVLGFFAFSKLLMYKDLDPEVWPETNNINDHELITQLIEGSDELGYEDTIKSEPYDEEYILEHLPLVLDADGSQTDSIVECLKGKSIVIEGPPGTGKSQTITNLIACFLNQNKTVLFVAEKMAALNVVYRNLKKVGLEDFCLELHSHKTNKKRLHDNLKKRLGKRFQSPEQLSYQLKSLIELRKPLQDYFDILGSIEGPSGESIYEIIGKIEKLKSSCEFLPTFKLESVETISQRFIDKRNEILSSLSRFDDEAIRLWTLNWFGYRPVELYSTDLDGIQDNFKELIKLSSDLKNLKVKLDDLHGLENDTISYSLFDLIQLNTAFNRLLPDNIILSLIASIMNTGLRESNLIINKLNDELSAFDKNIIQVSKVFTTLEELDIELIHSCYKYKNRIKEISIEDIGLNSIKLAIEDCRVVISSIDSIKKITNNDIPDIEFEANFISDLNKLDKIFDILCTKPKGMHAYEFEPYLNSEVKEIYFEAVNENNELVSNKNELSQMFYIEDAPDWESIKRIKQILRKNHGRFFSFLNKDVRNAKKKLKSIIKNKKLIKSDSIYEDLDKLQNFIKASNDFLDNEIYIKSFTNNFKGLETDWIKLGDVIHWVHALNKACRSTSEVISFYNYSRDNRFNDVANNLKELNKHLAEKLNHIKKCLGPNLDRILQDDSEISSVVSILSDIIEIALLYSDSFSTILKSEDITIKSLLSGLNASRTVIELKNSINSNPNYKNLLKESFNGVNSDIGATKATIDWIVELYRLDLSNDIIDEILHGDIENTFSEFKAIYSEFNNYISQINKGLEKLGEFGELNKDDLSYKEYDNLSIPELTERLVELNSNIELLPGWADYCRLVNQAQAHGLQFIIDLIDDNKIKPKDSLNIFNFNVFYSILKKILIKYPSLQTFTREEHEEKRSQFAKIDKHIQELQVQHISYKCSRENPELGNGRGPIRTWTEKKLIDREINKSMRHIPIRQLLDRASNAIRTLKPIFMMSPMSVAQYLKPGLIEFDIVIMDEASQIQPHEAFGAIARSDQAIIVGDPKQLPPTTFFDKVFENLDEEQEESLIDDTDSILDAFLSAHFKQKRLLWHYRSEHESLIAFSNSNWYENELTVFPSPKSTKTELGLKYHYLENATYSGGKNEVEAFSVANAIIEHAKRYPEMSLGVGTFNIRQKELIEDCLAKLVKEKPKYDRFLEKLNEANNGNEPLFIKNLENLQGDERDVIIISCTYGPDPESGKVLRRFGPINMKNGPRRLNVLFTRAKKRMELFTSMMPEEISIDRGYSEGALALKNFLQYAQTGYLPDFGTITDREPDSDFEIAVGKELKKLGYEIAYQVGVAGYFIDIGVYHPENKEEFILGIECDGATYHSSIYARDRDRLKEEVIVRRGWNIHRIWSTDWFKNRKKEINRLNERLKILSESLIHQVTPEYEQYKPIQSKDKASITKSRFTNEELKNRLIAYRNANLAQGAESNTNSILRDEMIEAFVKHRPVNIDYFRSKLSFGLRNNIDVEEFDYLDDILGIIEESI
ncbi:MAG: DUF4011 domain-containing protein [PVC group bacterium]|nr:DUF4011 domain-containing protein [PVC group bacterium]